MGNNTKGIKHMIIEFENGIKFDLRENYPTDPIVIKEIWEENVYRTDDWRFEYEGDVVDLGSNIGAFSIYAASKGIKVYSVEPEPHNLEALNKNISLNNMEEKIVVCPYGISDYNGTAVISDEGGCSNIKDDGIFGATVEILTLNDFFELYNINEVSILKIDVEGAEPEIILGAPEETINKCRYIAVEFDIRTGNRLGEMVQKLSETHHVQTMGSWERGGMIFANRY
jgi:FkbM family methyltransferase